MPQMGLPRDGTMGSPYKEESDFIIIGWSIFSIEMEHIIDQELQRQQGGGKIPHREPDAVRRNFPGVVAHSKVIKSLLA